MVSNDNPYRTETTPTKASIDDPIDILNMLNAGVISSGQARLFLIRWADVRNNDPRTRGFSVAYIDALICERKVPWWRRLLGTGPS